MILACALLLAASFGLSWSAARTKSATFDEPLHLVGGALHRFHGDFRVNPEDPALFGHLAGLAIAAEDLTIDPEAEAMGLVLDDVRQQWSVVGLTLFGTEGNDPERALRSARRLFAGLCVALGAWLAFWAWRLAGPVAALVASLAFAFDPNFLAHGALVKNDVPLALVMLAWSYAAWSFGRTGSVWALLGLGLGTGAAFNMKFSGVLFAPMLALLFAVRAVRPESWRMCGRELASRGSRFAGAALAGVCVALVAWAVTWACYGFRFAPTPQGEVFALQPLLQTARVNELALEKPRDRSGTLQAPTQEELDGYAGGPLVQTIAWIESHRLFPQTWLVGFLYTYATTLVRSSFLLGEVSPTGWWYYFPVAMLVKTPLATLLASAFAALVALLARLRRRAAEGRLDGWTLACLVLPPGIYGAVALATNLNLGLRHVLPLYPFAFIGLGVVAAGLWERRRALALAFGGCLALGNGWAAARTWPDYLAYFPATTRAWRSPLELLSDSNLDWGQDLPALAEWRAQHPEGTLYLCYFGTADAARFGLEVVHLIGGWSWGEFGLIDPERHGYLAISATHLQGVYLEGEIRDYYAGLHLPEHAPLAILGGSIYVYPWPLGPR